MSDSMVELVEEKIWSDQELCGDLIAEMEDPKDTPPKEFIRSLFPDFFQGRSIATSNNPVGISVAHYLLLGGAPVVDIRPDRTVEEFEQEHGMTRDAMALLARERLLIPNLYFRDPNSWAGQEGMRDLVERSYVVGERVDIMLSIIFPEYEKAREDRFQTLRSELGDKEILHTLSSDLQERTITENDLRASATRWAYLDAFSPEDSKRTEHLLSDGDFAQAVHYLHVQKWAKCTDVTGCVGGEFIYGPENLSNVDGVPTIAADQEKVVRALLKNSPALEYLSKGMSGALTINVLENFHVQKIVDFLKNEENTYSRDRMLQGITDITQLALNEGVRDDDIRALYELIEDYKRRIHEQTNVKQQYRKWAGNVAKETIAGFGAIGMGAKFTIDLASIVMNMLALSPRGYATVKPEYTVEDLPRLSRAELEVAHEQVAKRAISCVDWVGA